MNDLNILIEQMAADISSQAVRLDDLRLKLFLEWLKAHSSKVKAITDPHAQGGLQVQIDAALIRDGIREERLKTGLRMWIESLPMQEMLREYHLILDEIAWWRDLDARRLSMIMRSEVRK
ncbi:MAG: hypothetical protein L6Q49_16915 [Anaerolineales bacterium]|nr:hypothetical protein [Anaerolineales bacterium]